MCLDVIHKRKPNPVGKGYKIFRRVRGKLYPMYVRSRGDYPLRRWIKSSDQKIRHADYCAEISKYHPGFHIYANKEEAEEFFHWLGDEKSYCLKRVEYQGAHTSGTLDEFWVDMTSEVIVAEEMRIQK